MNTDYLFYQIFFIKYFLLTIVIEMGYSLSQIKETYIEFIYFKESLQSNQNWNNHCEGS